MMDEGPPAGGFQTSDNVRFTPKADMCGALADVGYGPEADLCSAAMGETTLDADHPFLAPFRTDLN